MKKIVSMFLVLGLCEGLTGCGNKTDYAETQKKIENAGWKIDLQRDVGTDVDELNLIINEIYQIQLSRFKDDDEIKGVTFCEENYLDKYYVNYDINDKKDDALHHTVDNSIMNCVGYNLTDEEKDSEWDDLIAECPIDDLKHLKNLQKYRDTILSENNLTLKELYNWAVWYYKNN